MKVQKIEQSVSFSDMESRGSMAGKPGSPDIELLGLKKVIPGKEEINTGIFECTAGTYERVVKNAEVMHILAGNGSFTPENEETITFNPGDTLFFAEDTKGSWIIESRMRKFYAIF